MRFPFLCNPFCITLQCDLLGLRCFPPPPPPPLLPSTYYYFHFYDQEHLFCPRPICLQNSAMRLWFVRLNTAVRLIIAYWNVLLWSKIFFPLLKRYRHIICAEYVECLFPWRYFPLFSILNSGFLFPREKGIRIAINFWYVYCICILYNMILFSIPCDQYYTLLTYMGDIISLQGNCIRSLWIALGIEIKSH